MCNIKYNAHTEPLFKGNRLLLNEDIFKPNCLKFYNKFMNKNNDNHVYRQSQVRKPIGSGVKWAECLLIRGPGCWVQVFSLILDSAVGLWVGIQSAGEFESETSQLRILHSAEEDNLSPFDSKIACLCQIIEINNKHVLYIYIYLYVYAFVFIHVPANIWLSMTHAFRRPVQCN